jgi:hypothetical protein
MPNEILYRIITLKYSYLTFSCFPLSLPYLFPVLLNSDLFQVKNNKLSHVFDLEGLQFQTHSFHLCVWKLCFHRDNIQNQQKKSITHIYITLSKSPTLSIHRDA